MKNERQCLKLDYVVAIGAVLCVTVDGFLFEGVDEHARVVVHPLDAAHVL